MARAAQQNRAELESRTLLLPAASQQDFGLSGMFTSVPCGEETAVQGRRDTQC